MKGSEDNGNKTDFVFLGLLHLIMCLILSLFSTGFKMLEGTKINSTSQMSSIFDIAKDTVLFLILSCYYILESVFWTLVPNVLRPMKSLKGDIVLVTGGGGGVGKQLALKLARLGAGVVLWDVNKKGWYKVYII